MVLLKTPPRHPDWPAPDFDLRGVDGKRHTLATARGENGLLVMFICNHCPYVKAVLDHIIRDSRELETYGIGSIAIMSNDPGDYPEDSWDNMVELSRRKAFPFPYVLDDTQHVAKAYDAVCTPDFFGFNGTMKLQYRGRIDATGPQKQPADTRRELFEAMVQIAQTGKGPEVQHNSIGCSIKWRE